MLIHIIYIYIYVYMNVYICVCLSVCLSCVCSGLPEPQGAANPASRSDTGLGGYMSNTRNEETNTVFYSYLACFVKRSTGDTHTPQSINQTSSQSHTHTGRGEAASQRHLRGSKPCVAKRHRLGGLCPNSSSESRDLG